MQVSLRISGFLGRVSLAARTGGGKEKRELGIGERGLGHGNSRAATRAWSAERFFAFQSTILHQQSTMAPSTYRRSSATSRRATISRSRGENTQGSSLAVIRSFAAIAAARSTSPVPFLADT